MSLPVEEVLGELGDVLAARAQAVLIAPPGAGKTSLVAPALLEAGWCDGQILLLSPRRLAARAAAERMAFLRGEAAGETIGYSTRFETRSSSRTRILVLTEGLFLRRIQEDPELNGVSAILFDEVHERSLDSDFALALALDAQSALRPDLRLLAMSASLDGELFSRLMNDAPILRSQGRQHPVEIVHLGRSVERRIEEEMAAACRRALAEAPGSLLAFLPGVAEIERCAERLDQLPPDVDLIRLHGALEPAEQRRAIAPAPAGRRKLVLATSIAETSLTLEGIGNVVDSGLARRPRFDRGAGVTRLVTERASQAAVTQRAGRAGRQGPGRVYRLWEEAATRSLPAFDRPEILEADLAPLLLQTSLWGVDDPRRLRWLEPPPVAGIEEARRRLLSLGALAADGRPTPHGRAMAALPLPPRLAHMMIDADRRGWTRTAAEVAVLLSERGLGGSDEDLEKRLEGWRRDKGPRARSARALADRWRRLFRSARDEPAEIGACVALAFPDRLARRRGESGDWISVGGRGFRLDPASPLAGQSWLAVAEVAGAASGARIVSAAPIEAGTVERLFGDRIETSVDTAFDAASGLVRSRRRRRLGAITLASGPAEKVDPAETEAALLEGVRRHGLSLLPWPATATALRKRAAFTRGLDPEIADLSDEALLARLDEWLPPLLAGRSALSAVEPGGLTSALDGLLGWAGRRAVDRLAPPAFETPAGSRHEIDYLAEAGPTVTLRVQSLFGLSEHPRVGDEPLVLALTSPAGRVVQTTRDLPGFWRGSWADVAREMRGRYPRHPWPDDPARASPTLKTKKKAAG